MDTERKPALGLRGQLIAGMVITTVAGIGLVGLLSIKTIEKNALSLKLGEAESLMRLAQAEAAGAGGGEALEAVSRVLRSAGVGGFSVRLDDGIAFREGIIPEAGEPIHNSGGLSALGIGGGFFSGPVALVVSSGGHADIGFVMPLEDLNRDLSSIRKFFVLYSILISAVIIGFGSYFLSKWITGPIKRLDEAAERLASGRLGERAEVLADNEIGSLAGSFNAMAGRLEGEIRALDRVNRELLNAQEEVLKTSTLAAVGRLAAGIAHEIGNPLGAVKGYIDILSGGGLDKADEKEVIERLSREAGRIDSIIRDFLDVSRPLKRPGEPLDVNGVVSEISSSLGYMPEFSSVKIRTELSAGLPSVLMEEGRLRQVVMNILINASHSFEGVEGERRIDISTGEIKRPAAPFRGRRKTDLPVEAAPAERPFVFVRVSDNGCGIGEADAARIFEPFYTTKDSGKGTGLGLFVSQSIIKAHGGEIVFTPGQGRGSEFTVMLPADTGAAA